MRFFLFTKHAIIYLLLLLSLFLFVLSKNYIHRPLIQSTVRISHIFFLSHRSFRIDMGLPDATRPTYSHHRRRKKLMLRSHAWEPYVAALFTDTYRTDGIRSVLALRVQAAGVCRSHEMCFEIECHTMANGVVNGKISDSTLSRENMQGKDKTQEKTQNKLVSTNGDVTSRSHCVEIDQRCLWQRNHLMIVLVKLIKLIAAEYPVLTTPIRGPLKIPLERQTNRANERKMDHRSYRNVDKYHHLNCHDKRISTIVISLLPMSFRRC